MGEIERFLKPVSNKIWKEFLEMILINNVRGNLLKFVWHFEEICKKFRRNWWGSFVEAICINLWLSVVHQATSLCAPSHNGSGVTFDKPWQYEQTTEICQISTRLVKPQAVRTRLNTNIHIVNQDVMNLKC